MKKEGDNLKKELLREKKMVLDDLGNFQLIQIAKSAITRSFIVR